jgi:SAM-dependent methyltransferase
MSPTTETPIARHRQPAASSSLARWAPYLDRYRRGEWRDRIFRDMVLEDVRDHCRPMTLLDVGCGRGFDGDLRLQVEIASEADRFIGVEPDPGVALGPHFSDTHRCLLEEAPLAPASVDVAYAIMVLEHLSRPELFWDKLWEVLKDGGVFWGLTVDGRHWFTRASLWAERLRIKNAYLEWFLGRRGVERYENYPAHYRTNSPRQIARYANRFRSCELINFSRVGQLNGYLPRPFHPMANLLDRRAIRRGKPGTLLVVRAVK